jgi:hypothetical protein
MSSVEPTTGLVISYNYLWKREHQRGEDSGRKARPACVAVPVGATAGQVILFPITTQTPGTGRLAVEIPEIERRRLTLYGPHRCWVILDEANSDVMPGSYHLHPISLNPAIYVYGEFSAAFMRVMMRVLADALRTKQMRIVPRD